MARNNQKVNVQIILDGKKAEDLIDSMTKTVKKLREELQAVQTSELTDDDKNRRVSILTKEIRTLSSVLRTTKTATLDIQDIMDNLSGTTLRNLQSALRKVKLDMLGSKEDDENLQRLRKQYDAIDAQIQKIKKGYINVEDVVKNLDIASESMMRKAISQLRETRENTLRGTQEWEKYDNQIKLIEKTLASVGKAAPIDTTKVIGHLDSSTTAEIKATITQMEALREETILGTNEWQKYTADIQKAKDYLNSFSKEQRMSVQQAQQIAADPNRNTIKDAQEAIAVLKEYRNTLAVSDVTGIRQVDAQIQKINESLQITKERITAATDILNNPKDFTAKQLRQAISELNNQLDEMTMNDPARDGIKKQIEMLSSELNQTKAETIDVSNILSRLPHASLKELNQAAKQLKEEMEALDTTTQDYAKRQADYINIKQRIDDINDGLRTQEGLFSSTIKRLANYVAVYWSFNQVSSILKGVFSENMKLSDSLADIRKTTGLTTEEIDELSTEIDSIDTRTGREELAKLAYEAGKLGYSAKENVLEFVKAGDQIQVALGEDLGAEAIKNLMKLNDILGTTKTLGIERALLATGSAINELGQSSTANEEYLVDFSQRLGGIAAQAKLSMPELLALAGTSDALAQSSEVAATALNKVFSTLLSDTEQVARAAGVGYEALKKVLDTSTMDAFLMVLDGLSKKGAGLGALAPLFKDLGSDGARLNQVLAAMTKNTEMLRTQLNIANEAYSEATSVTDEFNIKNETAAALWERMGNTLKELWVNSSVADVLKSTLSLLNDMVQALGRNRHIADALASSVIALAVAIATVKIQAKGAALQINGWTLVMKKAKEVTETFWKVLKKHPLAVIVTLISGVATGIISYIKSAKKAKSATEDLNRVQSSFIAESQKEITEINKLFGILQKAQKGTVEYQKAKEKIQNKYGEYLKGLSKEITSLENVAGAYKAISEAALKSARDRAVASGSAEAADKYYKESGNKILELSQILSDELGKEQAEKYITAIKETLTSGGTGLFTVINEEDLKKFDMLSYSWGKGLSTHNPVKEILGEINDARSLYDDTLKQLESKFALPIDNTQKVVIEFGNMAKTIKEAETEMERLKQEYLDIKPYAEESAADFDKRREDRKKAWREAEAVYRRLAGLEADDGPEGKRENKEIKRQKRIIDELTSSLNAYFTERENAIKQSYLNEDITAGQMAARIEQNNLARTMANAELHKAILKQDSDFIAKEYGMNEEYQKKIESLNLKDGQLIADEQNRLQEALNKEKEIRIQHLQEIQSILNENDPQLSVRQDYQAQLESLQLFQRNQEELDKVSASRRMEIFTGFSRDSRQMTVDSLRTELETQAEFAEYTKNMTEEEYAVLLLLLQNYLDEAEQAEVRARERKRNLIRKTWEGTDEKASFDQMSSDDQKAIQKAQWEEKFGLGSEEDVADAEILGLQHKMEALQAYYDFSKEAGLEDIKAKTELQELQQELDNKYLESQYLKYEKIKEYSDAVVSFSEDMGEAAFGEVDDRKAAAKKLISSVIDTTKKLIVQWATQKAMNALFKQGMLATDTAQATQSKALQISDASGEVAIEAAKTTANVELGIVSGTAKETSKKGLIGLAVGAVIAAALGALLSAAKGKANQAMSSVGGSINDSPASQKKLAAGMLTYAEGKYPVLGNDGKVYDAQYTPQLKTGVYSGGPHYAIFSEKQPEMVIDGPTTQRMLFNHRGLYDSIMYLSRNKTLPTYADGKYPENTSSTPNQEVSDTTAITAIILNNLAPIIEANAKAINGLNEKIASGLYVNMYGSKGLDESIKKRDRFNKKNGLT